MDVWTAIALLTLWGFITGIDSYSLKSILGLIPFWTGFVVGLMLGNVVVGAVIGGAVQLIALGMIPIGGAVPPDFSIVTALLVAAVIFGIIPFDIGTISGTLMILLPAGLLSMYFDIFARTINVTWVKLAETKIQEGKIDEIPLVHFSGLLVFGSLRALAFFISSYLLLIYGKDALGYLFNTLPTWVLNGFSVGGALLPALGLAILLVYLKPEQRKYTLLIPFLIVASINLLGYTFAFVLIAGLIILIRRLRKAPKIEVGTQSKESSGLISDSLLTQISIRTGFFLEPSWNFERMQALGYLFSILPALKLIYKNPEELKRAALFHLEFFNTNPFLAPILVGMDIAYEEKNPGDFEFVRGLKTGLMGAFAGLGDSLIYLVIGGILLIVGSTLAQQAVTNPILAYVPLIVLLIFDGVFVPFRIIGTKLGYKRGMSIVSEFSGEGIKFLREQFEWLAVFSIGALIPVVINVRIGIEPLATTLLLIDQAIAPFTLQTLIGSLIGLGFVLFAYRLRMKRLSALMILFILYSIGFILGATGLLSVVATTVVGG